MADLGGLPASAWTDPRLMLAQQLMMQHSDQPVRSGTQELALALGPVLGAWMMKKAQDNQTAALSDLYGIKSPSDGQKDSPGLFERIGNLFSGSPSSSPSPSPATPSGPTATSGMPAPQDASASAGTSGMPPVGATGSTQPTASTPSPSAMPQPGMGGPFARQIWQAYRMIQVGQERRLPQFVMQGTQMLQQIQQEQAKAAIDAAKEGKSLSYGPDGTISVSGVNGYNDTVAATEAAKAHAAEMAKLGQDITQSRIAQTNALNTGTMGTEAAKAGAVEGAQANARNASDLNYAGPKAYATTSATNLANAGRPLTPAERNDQEQKVAEQVRNYEPVKEYVNTAQGYQNVLSAAKGGDKASDINLIDGLVKMFNPGATVRQATFETFMEHSQGLPDNVIGMVKSFYSNGQHLAPETRSELLDQARNRMDAARTTYGQLAASVSDQAKSQGLNPRNVLPNVIDPLTAQEELARRRAAAAAAAQQQPVQMPAGVQP